MSGSATPNHFRFDVLVGGDGPSRALRARFQEIAGLRFGPEEPRPTRGANLAPDPRKLAGVGMVPDVVLRRGSVGDGGGLYLWLEGIRTRGPGTLRTVTIQLLDPDRPRRALQQWKLSNARVTRYTGPELNAKSGVVAIEELVLASERIDID